MTGSRRLFVGVVALLCLTASNLFYERSAIRCPSLSETAPSTEPNNDSETKQVTVKVESTLPPLSTGVQDPWKRTLLQRLDKVRELCGVLCSIKSVEELESHLVSTDASSLPYLTVPPMDCPALLDMEEIDAGDMSFPSRPPEELMPYYTLGGAIKFKGDHIYKQGYLEGEALTVLWSKADVENQIEQAKHGTLKGTYGVGVASATRNKLKDLNLEGKKILVIGSENPWIEAICLSLGAAHVTTLEYGQRESEHPQISTETPRSIREKARSGNLILFDGVVSYSSLEHSGLGRYGDALNPWGDLLAVARAACLTTPDAFFALNVPIGRDEIVWNAHRVYGRNRLPLIMSNWKALPPQDYSANRGISSPEKAASLVGAMYLFEKSNNKA